MVPSWADQLLLQLWMEQFDTLPIQCRHIEHMHVGVGFIKNYFSQNYSYENLDNFSLISLLNMHRWCLLNLTVQGFSLNLTVRGYLISIAYWLFSFGFIVVLSWNTKSRECLSEFLTPTMKRRRKFVKIYLVHYLIFLDRTFWGINQTRHWK